MAIFVSRTFSSTIWALTSPIEAILYVLHFWYECIRFPMLWFNVLARTSIFGYVTFWPVIEARRQFNVMCTEGRGVDGEKFSTRHSGALLDVLLPPELHNQLKSGQKVTKKYPVIILFSGGAWILGRRLWMRPLLLHYADAGFIAVAADYLQWPFGTMPIMIKDALESISWVFDQIERPGSMLEHADADQVIVLGQSAGSHIASLAMLEMAQIRKEQMMLVAQGVSGSDKPYLKSKLKGVPLAFVGVGGMFDLVSAVNDMHKKGLHRRVLESLCEGSPLPFFCAKTRSEQVAEEARKRLIGMTTGGDALSAMFSADNNEATPDSGSSSAGEIPDKLDATHRPSSATTVHLHKNGKKKFPSSSTTASPLNSTKSNLELEAEAAFKKLEGSSAVNFLPRFSLFVHGDMDNSAPLDQAMRMCAAFNDASARHPHELVGTEYRMEKRHPNFDCREPFYTLVPKPKPRTSFDTAVKKAVHKRTVSSSSMMTPHSLFAGIGGKSSDLFSSLVNPATLRSPTNKAELLSQEIPIFEKQEKREDTSQDDIPFEIQEEVDEPLCDCYAGSRSIFMSYIRATHTTLIVDDFFIEKANPPLVVCVKALLATLNEIAEKHATIEVPVVSPAVHQETPTFDSILKSVVSRNSKNTQSPAVFSPETIPKTKIAECSCCSSANASPATNTRSASNSKNFNSYVRSTTNNNNNNNDDNDEVSSIQSINRQNSSRNTFTKSNSNRFRGHHQREVSGSFIPDFADQEKHPYDYLCAPQSIAVPTDLFIKTFEKNYSAIDKMELRNPERPVIPEYRRWFAQKISAF